MAIFQVSVPGEGHENVGAEQQQCRHVNPRGLHSYPNFLPRWHVCTILCMLKISLCVLALSCAALSEAAPPVIDNERVTVWDTMSALPPAQHDFVAVSFAKKAKPFFGHKGDIAGTDGVRTA